MPDFINTTLDLFTNYLYSLSPNLKESKTQNFIVSFAVKSDGIDLQDRIDHLIKYSEKSFYFEKPEENFLILGIDELLSINENGERRFTATDKKIKELKLNFISNWKEISLIEKPLFLGGMKFCVERQVDEWGDFNDSTWFIPEIIFLKHKNDSYVFLNFLYNLSIKHEYLVEKFRSKLENLSRIPEERIPEKLKINKSEGSSPKDKKKWRNLVKGCLDNIINNKIKKIVVSRRIEMLLSGELNLDYVLEDFRKKYSGCYLFIFHQGKSSFFGATPERLVKFSNMSIIIEALAGSAPRGKTDDEDRLMESNLLKSKKDIQEHDFVINHIKDSVSNLVENLKEENKYSIKKLKNIQHISTIISARLNSHSTPLNIIKELFPTPAVCGVPKEASLNLIKKLESYYRGLYSGIIGWFNFEGEGEFVVAIRSALTFGNKLIAYAGSGIVEQSDPDLEFEETELKFRPILSLFNENK